jgi:hypothetical protein
MGAVLFGECVVRPQPGFAIRASAGLDYFGTGPGSSRLHKSIYADLGQQSHHIMSINGADKSQAINFGSWKARLSYTASGRSCLDLKPSRPQTTLAKKKVDSGFCCGFESGLSSTHAGSMAISSKMLDLDRYSVFRSRDVVELCKLRCIGDQCFSACMVLVRR